MIRTERRLRLCRTLLLLNLCFIWGNSLLPGSVSGAFSDWVKSLLEALFSDGNMEVGGGLLRKVAHFTEFASLGALLAWLCGMCARNQRFALLGGAMAACLDETIQMFVPDRGPSITDVGIDTCGVIAGMVLLHFGYFLWKRKQLTISGGNEQ